MHLQFTTLLHNKNKSVGRDGLDGEKWCQVEEMEETA